jgi:hypothetical protein
MKPIIVLVTLILTLRAQAGVPSLGDVMLGCYADLPPKGKIVVLSAMLRELDSVRPEEAPAFIEGTTKDFDTLSKNFLTLEEVPLTYEIPGGRKGVPQNLGIFIDELASKIPGFRHGMKAVEVDDAALRLEYESMLKDMEVASVYLLEQDLANAYQDLREEAVHASAEDHGEHQD